MVSRIYVEKKPGFDVEAGQLLHELQTILGVKALTGLRLVNRYDVEGISDELFNQCIPVVFSEPQVDIAQESCPEVEAALKGRKPLRARRFSPSSSFPVSSTSALILRANVSSSSARVNALRFAAPKYMCWRASLEADVAAISITLQPSRAREAALEHAKRSRCRCPNPSR